MRYALHRAMGAQAQTWPWPTFTANIVGGLAMGVLAAWLLRAGEGGEPMRLLLGVGVLGGFTTFSAFSLELARMIERGAIGMAAGYALASVLLALLALFAGLFIGRSIWA